MYFYGKTDVGMRRSVNQDNFMVRAFDDMVLAAVVCDGMGGANGGNVASSMATRSFMQVISDREAEFPLFSGMSEEEINDMLVEASVEANRTVYRKSSVDEALAGMGTTLVGCLVLPDMIYAINVGDSRMYVTHSTGIRQITHDHSMVQYLVDIGQLTPEEARHSRHKNIITRAVGTERTVNADVFMLPRADACGEYIILCSDGLTNHVEPEEIGCIVGKCSHEDGDSLAAACESLIRAANDDGGSDNITAVIIAV